MNTTKLKPFDLDKALAGAKVVTRDGREVKIAGYNKNANPLHMRLAWVGRVSFSFYENGRFLKNDEISDLDLFLASDVREYWVCLWVAPFGTITPTVGFSKEDAEQHPLEYKYEILKTEKFYEEEI